MFRIMLIIVCMTLLSLTGCKSAEKREADARADIEEERLKVMKKYTDCLERYEKSGDAEKKCAPYKEAAETLLKPK